MSQQETSRRLIIEPDEEILRKRFARSQAMKLFAAILVPTAFLVAGCATVPDHGGCIDASAPRGESRVSIQLNQQPQSPFFYFRSLNSNFAIVVPPQSAIDLLKSSDLTSQELLKRLQEEMPITSDTDLFRYALMNSFYFRRIGDVTAELLARGEASLLYVGTGEYLPTVEVKSENHPADRHRTLHEPIGKEMIARTLDCISD